MTRRAECWQCVAFRSYTDPTQIEAKNTDGVAVQQFGQGVVQCSNFGQTQIDLCSAQIPTQMKCLKTLTKHRCTDNLSNMSVVFIIQGYNV
jgi:hypothetical protein